MGAVNRACGRLRIAESYPNEWIADCSSQTLGPGHLIGVRRDLIQDFLSRTQPRISRHVSESSTNRIVGPVPD